MDKGFCNLRWITGVTCRVSDGAWPSDDRICVSRCLRCCRAAVHAPSRAEPRDLFTMVVAKEFRRPSVAFLPRCARPCFWTVSLCETQYVQAHCASVLRAPEAPFYGSFTGALMELHGSFPLARPVKNKVSLCETQYAEAPDRGFRQEPRFNRPCGPDSRQGHPRRRAGRAFAGHAAVDWHG